MSTLVRDRQAAGSLVNPANSAAEHHEAMLAGRLVEGMRFDERVWAMTARIPAGRVTTYGRIAALLGSRGARAVGGALNRNPHAPAVPCHRVVGHDGRLCGFAHGIDAKRRLLQAEGVIFQGDRVARQCVIDPG